MTVPKAATSRRSPYFGGAETPPRSPRLEEKILIGEALLSHWDLRGSGLDVWAYRAALLRLLERAGFERFDTSQPEVALDPASFLIARIGRRTSSESRSAFLARVAGR